MATATSSTIDIGSLAIDMYDSTAKRAKITRECLDPDETPASPHPSPLRLEEESAGELQPALWLRACNLAKACTVDEVGDH
jgi:hypothetical protein